MPPESIVCTKCERKGSLKQQNPSHKPRKFYACYRSNCIGYKDYMCEQCEYKYSDYKRMGVCYACLQDASFIGQYYITNEESIPKDPPARFFTCPICKWKGTTEMTLRNMLAYRYTYRCVNPRCTKYKSQICQNCMMNDPHIVGEKMCSECRGGCENMEEYYEVVQWKD